MTQPGSTSADGSASTEADPISAVAELRSLQADSVRDSGDLYLEADTPLFRVEVGNLTQGQLAELTQIAGLANGVAFDDQLALTLWRERDDGLYDNYGTVVISTADLGLGVRDKQFLGTLELSGMKYTLTYEVTPNPGTSN
jgi:hypothetical protein